jgi:hypothetical protein
MIKENTYVVNFWLGNLFAKENKINEQRQNINIATQREIMKEASTMKEDVDVPELVDINYEELKKFHCPKKAGFLKNIKMV